MVKPKRKELKQILLKLTNDNVNWNDILNLNHL